MSLRRFWRGRKYLIINEISMCSNQVIGWINERLQQILGSADIFGGLSLLTFGDLLQLAPVKPSGGIIEDVCAGANAWMRYFMIIELDKN